MPGVLLGVGLLLATIGCSELNARRIAREGNELYHAGNYAEAAASYEQSEGMYPGIPAVVFNHGLACRQLMLTGDSKQEKEKATDCALASFESLQKLETEDDRAQRLYIQTLFDADRYEQLAAMYSKRHQERPDDLEAVNALIQVYSRWDKWDDALEWMVRRAEMNAKSADAAYSVGVFIYDRLFNKGGAGDATRFDPRPDVEQTVLPPAFAKDDVVDERRVALADKGIEWLKQALERRQKFENALVYLNLLYRQRALASLDDPEQWQKDVEQAEKWRTQAQAVAQETASLAPATAQQVDDDSATTAGEDE